jgi:preprotein translocase subunit YajC
MKDQKERNELISRRSVLTGSALLLTGGIAGRITNAYAAAAIRDLSPGAAPRKELD